LFNGRFAPYRAASEVAKSLNIQVFYHERGSSYDHFSLRPYMPHDNERVQLEIVNTWNGACHDDNVTACLLAEKFFTRKFNGEGVGWESFTKLQQNGLVSEKISILCANKDYKKVVSFFHSSEDEYRAVGDIFSQSDFHFDSQLASIQACASVCRRLNYLLIVRIHPHLCQKSKEQYAKWNNNSQIKALPNTFLVESDSPLSSYELIGASDAIVTHGSTCGIEAVFASKPSIVVGASFYSKTGAAVYEARDEQTLYSLLVNVNSLLVNKKSSYPYGYWVSSFGSDFKFFKQSGQFKGTFLGYESPLFREQTSLVISRFKLKSILRHLIQLFLPFVLSRSK
jgi:hypothetical protein